MVIFPLHHFLSQAFGVGALEEDDDDIFSRDNIASYHSTLGLPSDAEQSSKYGWTGGKDGGGTVFHILCMYMFNYDIDVVRSSSILSNNFELIMSL